MLIFIVKLIVDNTLLVLKQFITRRRDPRAKQPRDLASWKFCGQWTVLIGISLGGKNINSSAARRGATGALTGFVCDCFEEKHASLLRYGKIDVIRLLSERR